MEDPCVSLSKPKKNKSFSMEELVSSDFEETAGGGSLPRGRDLSQYRNQLVTVKSQETRVSPRKRGRFSPREEL